MLLALAAPADNPRGPRYMQEALAAIHQANHRRQSLTLEYAAVAGRVGLFCRVNEHFAPLVLGPLKAKYPNCSLTVVEDQADPDRDHLRPTWWAEVTLVPDLFPLLRHNQFEDIASGTFEDPIDALLQSISPDGHTEATIEIDVRPTRHRRHRRARRAVSVLDMPTFRRHHHLARWYARWITRPRLWLIPYLLTIGLQHPEPRLRSQIDTTAGRHHEREDDVQAASDKLGNHLFDAHIRLVVHGESGAKEHARQRLQAMIGALGSFTASRLAMFRVG